MRSALRELSQKGHSPKTERKAFMKPGCAIYVPKRHYGQPGPCQSKRAIKVITVAGTPIRACIGHRAFIQGGGKAETVKQRRLACSRS